MASIIGVETLQHTNGTTAATIDSSGRILQPALPAFRVGLTDPQNETTTGFHTVAFNETATDNCFIQGGITISSGSITVPVDGVYQFNANVRLDNIGSGYVEVLIVINGAAGGNVDTYTIDGSPPSNYFTLTPSDFYKLSAGDIVDVRINVSADTSWRISNATTFSGALVG